MHVEVARDGVLAPAFHGEQAADLSPLPRRDHGAPPAGLADAESAGSRDGSTAHTGSRRRNKTGFPKANARWTPARGLGTRDGSWFSRMPPPSQTAREVGNGDASLSRADERDTPPGVEHVSDGPGGCAGSADPPPASYAGAPARGTPPSNSAGPGRTTSTGSRLCHKGHKGSGGNRGAAHTWPQRAWTSAPKLPILDRSGERSPGPGAGDGELAPTKRHHLPLLFAPHSLSPKPDPLADVRAHLGEPP